MRISEILIAGTLLIGDYLEKYLKFGFVYYFYLFKNLNYNRLYHCCSLDSNASKEP